MSLGQEVTQAMNRVETDDGKLRVYECSGCGRAFAREHESCPACGGDVVGVLLH